MGNLVSIQEVETECNRLLKAWEAASETRNDKYSLLVQQLTDAFLRSSSAAANDTMSKGIVLHHPHMAEYCKDMMDAEDGVRLESPPHMATLCAWYANLHQQCETYRTYTGEWHTFAGEALFFSNLLKDIASVWNEYVSPIGYDDVGRLLVDGARTAALPFEAAYQLMTMVGYHEREFEVLIRKDPVCGAIVDAAQPHEKNALIALLKLVYVYYQHSPREFDEMMTAHTEGSA